MIYVLRRTGKELDCAVPDDVVVNVLISLSTHFGMTNKNINKENTNKYFDTKFLES